mgnify:CR=1 FL=1
MQIKSAVEQAFPNVKVHSVNVMVMPGKRRRWKRWYAFQNQKASPALPAISRNANTCFIGKV